MAAFRDDMPLVAGVNEDWDENTTRAQLVRPDWDFSPIRMQTMHHLPHIFFDTLRPERPDCPVLIPSSFSASPDRIISQNIYSYEPCGPPTGTKTWELRTQSGLPSLVQSDAKQTIHPRHDAQRHGGRRDSSTTVARTRTHSYYRFRLRLHHG